MQISYQWLQEYIAFDWSPEELADRLTMIGTAVEKVEPLYEKFTGVIVARIEKVEPHPQKDQLSLCTLATGGGGGSAVVVCGAPNAHPGQYSPYAPPGAKLPGQGKVTTAKISGVSSAGFLCSEAELSLSEDADLLMVLDPEQAEAGMNLWEFLQLDDWILRFELTPNRPDCLSALGLAREIGALTGAKLRRPEIELTETGGPVGERVKVEIADPEGCPRYAARVIDNVKIARSPFWLKRRLHSAGIRAINNVVDLTNYVMIETGQPLHAFDFGKFTEARVLVRGVEAGEKFVTLDQETRELPAEAVMITDGTKAVAVGGVMGGLDSEVSPETTTILLESAYFNPIRIRRTRTALGLATQSAIRFEKGVDPNGVDFALDRAAALLVSLTAGGGEVLRGIEDCYPQPIEPLRLEVRPARTNKIIGMELASPKMIDILSALEFGVSAGKTIAVVVPTFRPDITREIDLIEEIARLVGYEEIPVRRMAAGRIPPVNNAVLSFEGQLRETLVGQGLFEVVTNSLVDPGRLSEEAAQVAPQIKNPLSGELSVMRPSLCGSLLSLVAHNFNRQISTVRIFEIGRVFTHQAGAYDEQRMVGLALAGDAPTTRWEHPTRPTDFFDLKGILVSLFDRLHMPIVFHPGTAAQLADQGTFEVRHQDTSLGYAGLIDPAICARYDVKEPVWGAFLDFARLFRGVHSDLPYQPVPRFPRAQRDCAVIIDQKIAAGDLVEAIAEVDTAIIEGVEIFDVYTGKPIPAGEKSVALAVSYRDLNKTLTDEQVNVVQAKVVSVLKNKFKARLRE